MRGSRRGLIITGVVLFAVLGVAAVGLLAVTLIHRAANHSAAEVARAVDDEVRMGGVVGATPATCPAGVRAEVGRSVRCSVTVEGQPVDVVVQISAVRLISAGGPKIGYGIRLEPNPVPRAVLERKVGELVGGATGAPVDARPAPATCGLIGLLRARPPQTARSSGPSWPLRAEDACEWPHCAERVTVGVSARAGTAPNVW